MKIEEQIMRRSTGYIIIALLILGILGIVLIAEAYIYQASIAITDITGRTVNAISLTQFSSSHISIITS